MNDDTSGAVITLVLLVVQLVLFLGVYVMLALGLSRVFRKLGVPVWRAWVPFVNTYTVLEQGGRSGWWAIALAFPLVNIAGFIMLVLAIIALTRRFGRSDAFAVLGVVLLPVWALVLGFGSAVPLGRMDAAAYDRRMQGIHPDAAGAAPSHAAPVVTHGPVVPQPPVAPSPAAYAGPPAGAAVPPAPRLAVPEHVTAPPPPPLPAPAPGAPAASSAPPALWSPPPGVDTASSPVPPAPAAAAPPAAAPAVPPLPAPVAATGPRPQWAPPQPEPVAEPAAAAQAAEQPVDSWSAPPAVDSWSAPAAPPVAAAATAPAPAEQPAPVAEPPAPETTQPEPPPAAPMSDDLENTLVSARRRRTGWSLTPAGSEPVLITHEIVVLGRNPQATTGEQRIVLADPSKTVSKTHARLELRGESWWLTDLTSTNGVFVLDAGGVETELAPDVPSEVHGAFMLGELAMVLEKATR